MIGRQAWARALLVILLAAIASPASADHTADHGASSSEGSGPLDALKSLGLSLGGASNEPEFLGPAAIALGHRYNLDTRDEGTEERHEIFRGEGTVFSCSYANECSEVCPKGVDPAAAVNQAKFGAVIDWAKGLVLPRAPRAAD